MEKRLVTTERLASMGTLAASVGHEINNPLSFVIGNLDVIASLVSRDEGTERLRQCIADAREGADRVRHIVRGLLTFARGDDAAVGPVDVHAVLDRSVELAQNEIRHRARLVKDYAAKGRAGGNAVQLAQVFVNLLVNAAQAIKEGHAAENEIRVRTKDDGDALIVSVEDTGIGIPAEARAHVFEPFFTTKPIGSGTGLGLSVCMGIVRRFGGSIDVESEPGMGSTFRVRLPACAAAEESAPVCAAPQSRARRRVLVVDDEPKVASVLRLLLAEEHDVEVATSKEACARILGGDRFDVVLCDLMMPDMNGMDLHAALAKNVPDQASRMVFMSGGAFTPDAKAFLAKTGNPTIEKPFRLEELRAVLGAAPRTR